MIAHAFVLKYSISLAPLGFGRGMQDRNITNYGNSCKFRQHHVCNMQNQGELTIRMLLLRIVRGHIISKRICILMYGVRI